MANKISEYSVDEKFAASVSQALDKSIDDIDELSLHRLKKARVHALNQTRDQLTKKPSRKWISLSVAASLALLLLTPIVANQHLFNVSSDQDLEVVSQEVPLSAEELDDMDMLMALEDSDA